MGEAGLVRFQGSLDPRAQEFRPTTTPNLNLNATSLIQQHIHMFAPPPPPPPLPPPPPPQQLYYPYSPPHLSLGFPQYQTAPLPYISSTILPSLPPQSAAPTRTLVLSSVPTEVSETIVRRELEVFGEVRGVQMERICDGIVIVHFYDLRHAETALIEIRDKHMQQQTRLRNLFNNSFLLSVVPSSSPPPPPPSNTAGIAAARGLIAGCAVWAQFIIPSCNAVPDGYNHGTIVVFNLDPNVSTSSLKEIFQAFGAVKELRETPLKKQQRFVEFYDIRDAAKALKEMNGKEIHGKQVVIEFSRPGGFGRKFFNAAPTATRSYNNNNNNDSNNKNNSNTKTSSVHNTININTKVSRFAPTPQPQQSPPSLPLPRRLSRCSPSNIPPRACLRSKSLNFSKGNNPDENSNNSSKSSVEAVSVPVSIGCLPMSNEDHGVVDNEKVAVDGLSVKGNYNLKKSQNNHESGGGGGAFVTTTNSSSKQQNRNRPWKSRQGKKSDTRFLINEDAAMDESNCSDSRTTVMIKNIPNKYSQKLLLNMLDNHCIHCNEQIIAEGEGGNGSGSDQQPLSSYDFVYLPIDFNNKCNVGYGFVNMTSSQATLRLYKAFHHQHWEVFNSRKICEVTYARVQGLEALKEHFKNSKFPCEMDHYLPVVFSPPRDGRQLTEPQPIVGHGQKQHPLAILGVHMKHEDSLNNSKSDQEDEDDDEDNLNQSSSSQNGGITGDDDKDSSSGSLA